jgi:thiamine pyrophosphokinase
MEKANAMSEIIPFDFQPQAVVLGNGTFPVHRVPLSHLATAPFLLCCDGAVNKLVNHGLRPDFIIGDGDSISEENRERYADRFLRIADQETNDQTKAVDYLQGKGITRIAIIGATGGREDHTLGNISLLMEYRRRGLEVEMFTDTGRFVAVEGNATFSCNAGQQVSIISFGARGMISQGLKYPLHDLTNWWQGTLNEALSTHFSIDARGEYLVFMEYSK